MAMKKSEKGWVGAISIEVHRVDWHALGSHDSEIYFEPTCKQCQARNLDAPTLLGQAREALTTTQNFEVKESTASDVQADKSQEEAGK